MACNGHLPQGLSALASPPSFELCGSESFKGILRMRDHQGDGLLGLMALCQWPCAILDDAKLREKWPHDFCRWQASRHIKGRTSFSLISMGIPASGIKPNGTGGGAWALCQGFESSDQLRATHSQLHAGKRVGSQSHEQPHQPVKGPAGFRPGSCCDWRRIEQGNKPLQLPQLSECCA